MQPTVYLETSVILHLTDPTSPNPITRACQQLTQLWWHTRCDPNGTFISDYVLEDIESGDPLRALRRRQIVQHLHSHPKDQRITGIAELLISSGCLKARSMKAAEHIACSAFSSCEVLLTWNCMDIANAKKLPLTRWIVSQKEHTLPEMVTPFELMENSYETLWCRNTR